MSTVSRLELGGATKVFEVAIDEALDLSGMLIKLRFQEALRTRLPFKVALQEELGYPASEISRVLDLSLPPDFIELGLVSDEHNDFRAKFALLDGYPIDEQGNMVGFVEAIAGDSITSSVEAAYKIDDIVVDEVLLGISGANKNLFANGVLSPSHEVESGFMLAVTTEYDPSLAEL